MSSSPASPSPRAAPMASVGDTYWPAGASSNQQQPLGQDSVSHLVVSAPTAADTDTTMATSSAQPTEPRNKSGIFSQPSIIAIHGCEFFIHTGVLCMHSKYFQRCLTGPFIESQTQRIDIDDEDISVDDFALWANTVHLHYYKLRKTIALESIYSIEQMLTVLRLSDRFLHDGLRIDSENSLKRELNAAYTVENWHKLYASNPQAVVEHLQAGYNYCAKHRLASTGNCFVMACANSSTEAYVKYVSLLNKEFLALVSVRIIRKLEAELENRKKR